MEYVSRKPNHRFARLLIPTIALSLFSFVAWASWAEIDQITRVPGSVIPTSRNQIIEPMQQGMVEEITVREGDRVHAGQVLVRFDRARAEAAYLETRSRLAAQIAAIARLQGELASTRPVFPAMLDDYPSIVANHQVLFDRRQQALRDEIAVLEQTLELIDEELGLALPLQAQGDVSQVEVLRLRRQRVEVQGAIVNRRNGYYQEVQAELSRAQEELEGLEQQLVQQRELREYTTISAPMDGIIRNVQINTRGGVARPGEEIMQIVPIDDDFIIEAKVAPRDIAYVRPGLPANIKFDAYDFMIYGSFPGEVTYISIDTLEDETSRARGLDDRHYRVHVRMEGKDLQGRGAESISIQPGMTATVEILTGSNTVLGFLAKPITRGLQESLSER
jgi:adhesin transport system membrane fusion protein